MNFSSSLAKKVYVFAPTLVDLNLVELKYYPLIISLTKCSESWDSDNDLSTKMCVPSKTKDINFKTFNKNDK